MVTTADGANTGSFGPTDWALTTAVAVIWGSSFLWIAIGLDSLPPAAVAFGRLVLGAAVLGLLPSARRPVPRHAWPTVFVVAVAGNAGPALLLAFAQQTVESSVAGMINAATPLSVLVVGMAMTRRHPGIRQVVGLVVGFCGVVAMAAPNVAGADAQPVGIALLLVAMVGYGVSNNVIVPVQQTFGAPAIVCRAQLVGAIGLAPFGVAGFARSSPTAGSLMALVILGVVGTGIARALNATLAGRAGAARGSITTYLAVVFAISLGVVFRGDTIEGSEIAGTALVLIGAAFASRAQRPTNP